MLPTTIGSVYGSANHHILGGLEKKPIISVFHIFAEDLILIPWECSEDTVFSKIGHSDLQVSASVVEANAAYPTFLIGVSKSSPVVESKTTI